MRAAWILVVVAACEFSTRVAPFEDAPGTVAPEGSVTSPEAGASNPEAGGGATCTQGTACNDGDACTEFDTCLAGTCSGIDDLCPAMCATTCAACGGDTCCAQSCPNGMCPSCPANCDCSLSCGTQRPCSGTCVAGASCKIFGTDNEADGAYNVTCEAGSYCVVNCVGDEGSCTVNCAAGAVCLVIDSMQAASSTLTCVGGTTTTCPNNIKVCNRPCP